MRLRDRLGGFFIEFRPEGEADIGRSVYATIALPSEMLPASALHQTLPCTVTWATPVAAAGPQKLSNNCPAFVEQVAWEPRFGPILAKLVMFGCNSPV